MSSMTTHPCLKRKGRHIFPLGACPHCELKRAKAEIERLEASRKKIFEAADGEIERLRAELAASRHELEGAKKAANAQARIIESLQQQQSAHLHAQRDKWVEARDTLESERAANARLTDELAASREREARMQWQPIETAPTDGARILLCGKGGKIADGYYGQPDGFANPKRFVWPYIHANPTHWMPLQAPPAALAEGAQG